MSKPVISHAVLDLDSLPYVGASVAEKPTYQWFRKDGTSQSAMFDKAKDAKEWLEGMVGFHGEDPNDWERKRVYDLKDVSVAVKAMGYEFASWEKSIKRLTGNPNIKYKGYLTCSGLKNKDVDHLEVRYQHNRYESRSPKNLPEGCDKYTAPWVKKWKPTHLGACRTHLMVTKSWCKMSPVTIEADAPAIFVTEKMGLTAVLVSKDKDLKQAMKGYYIDMNPKEADRVMIKLSVLGNIGFKRDAKGAIQAFSEDSTGFKLIMGQTIAGDSSDGYGGLKGVGIGKAVELLENCETVEECCQVVADVYAKKYPDGYSYVDWNKQSQEKTWQEICIQHCQLAYHERGSKDILNPMSRFLEGYQPIYYHGGFTK